MRVALFASLSLFALCAHAQDFKARCEATFNIVGDAGRVVEAKFSPAENLYVGPPFPLTVTSPVPDNCLIRGRINERIGIHGKPYWIGYEIRLPEKWNGKFFFQGGGGLDGLVRPAIGSLRGEQTDNALSRGYAVASTDAGHLDEKVPLGDNLFGLDPQARIDKGHNHLPTVSKASHQLIRLVYEKPASKSYFLGCSNGGRQGMAASQRYPALFDGIIAMAPAHRVPLAAIEGNYHNQLLASIAPKFENGALDLGSALTPEDMNIVRDGILEKCDALDGVKDGQVFNPKACAFNVQDLTCKQGQNSACLPANKTEVLAKMFKGVSNSKGEKIYSDWYFDPSIAHPAWRAWRLGTPKANPANGRNVSLIPGSLAYVFHAPPEPTNNVLQFSLNYNFDKDPPKVWRKAKGFEGGMHFEGADSTNIDAYKARGGKLLLTHGNADPIFSVKDTERYMDAVQKKYGKSTGDFARFFEIPGLNHCGGGVTTDKFDALTALENWVEKGQAPEVILAAARPNAGNSFAGRTRPLCVYPKYAHYNGTGDSEKAESFTCKS